MHTITHVALDFAGHWVMPYEHWRAFDVYMTDRLSWLVETQSRRYSIRQREDQR